MICSRVICWKSSASSRYRGLGVSDWSPQCENGCVPAAAIRLPSFRAASITAFRSRTSSARTSARVRQTGVPISICDRNSSFVTSSPTACCALRQHPPGARPELARDRIDDLVLLLDADREITVGRWHGKASLAG